MNSILYSWLSAAAVAPFVALLSSWTLVVFRSYRRDWRLLDIFLFALTCLEVASSLFGFGYAILGVIRPALEAPCRFILWGLAATRIFHLATVTSLLLDRALAAKWPKAYRSSVRHSQVRYHIVVLAVVSVFVGVTSVFARLPSPSCTLQPSEWDLKFSGFLACVHVFLLLTGIVCCLSVQIGRFGVKGSYRTSWSRDSATSSSSASSGESRDLEWGVVSCVCWLSYLLNHAPFLVLTVLGLFIPTFWSPWVDNAIVWLRLAQGLLVPWMILIADLPHRSALRNMLRQPGRVYRHLSDHGGFRIKFGDAGMTKPPFPAFPLYRVPPFPQRLRWSPAHLPSLQSLHPLDADSLNKGNYGSGGYTTLLSLPSSTTSTTFSSPFSSCSSYGKSVNSVTTNAVDDFVFRRPSVLAVFDSPPVAPKDHHKNGVPRRLQEIFESPPPIRRHDYNVTERRCDTPTPFAQMEDREDGCTCDLGTELPTARSVINENMINIILSYDSGDTSTSDSAGMLSSTDRSISPTSTSSESSDADSIQSVIIRQRVDQNGRVSNSDISRAERKFVRCRPSEDDFSSESSSSDCKVIYSEYL